MLVFTTVHCCMSGNVESKCLLQYIAAWQGVLKASVYYRTVLHGRAC